MRVMAFCKRLLNILLERREHCEKEIYVSFNYNNITSNIYPSPS